MLLALLMLPSIDPTTLFARCAAASSAPTSPVHMQASSSDASPAELAARVVFMATICTAAAGATVLYTYTLPLLNPNQPNHSMNVPSVTKAMSWPGRSLVAPLSKRPRRGPQNFAPMSPNRPPAVWESVKRRSKQRECECRRDQRTYGWSVPACRVMNKLGLSAPQCSCVGSAIHECAVVSEERVVEGLLCVCGCQPGMMRLTQGVHRQPSCIVQHWAAAHSVEPAVAHPHPVHDQRVYDGHQHNCTGTGAAMYHTVVSGSPAPV